MATRRAFGLMVILGLVFLSGCQPVGGNPGVMDAQKTPLPLTGDQASIAGASALLVESNPSNAGFSLVPISARDGRPASGLVPVDLGVSPNYTFSQNRERIAYVTNSIASCPNACLHILNLHTWKEEITPVVLPDSLADLIKLAFDPTGKMIALFIDSNAGNGGQLLLVDLTQDKIIQQVNVNSNIFQLAFTPQGGLAVYGNRSGDPNKLTFMYVTLFSIPSLSVSWQQDLAMVSYGTESLDPSGDPSQGEYLYPAAVFSLDQSRLFVVAADEPRLVTIDFARQAVSSATIQPPRSLLERLLDATASVVYAKMLNGTTKTAVLSADGKYLYVVGQTTTAVKDKDGNWSAQTTPLGLQVVIVADGAEVAKLDTTASNISLSLDGKTLLLNGWDDSGSGSSRSWTDVVDVASMKVTRRFNSELLPSRLLDGSLAWLSNTWSDSGGISKMEIYHAGTQAFQSKLIDSEMLDSYWVPIP